ncbi:Homer protein isoform 1 [Theobroma cacao]|uniref:Homer protein isoform 1 n=1 Tax=Theobroma cacao TaxID=3641 RepID=A0A061GGM1_THECC|nr:Homer protein isoform 1 [Theobroma cacao]
MVELQSCASLVNASALCAIEQEMKGESVNVIAEIAAELQREREKNAELMKRISSLEAQIQEREKESLLTNEKLNPSKSLLSLLNGLASYVLSQVSCLDTTERSLKRFKRQKIETYSHRTEDGKSSKTEMASKAENGTQCMPSTDENQDDRLVNWMSMDETLFSHFDKFKDSDLAADREDTDDSDDEDEYYEEDDPNTGYKDRETEENLRSAYEEQPHEDGVGPGMHISCLQSYSTSQSELTFTNSSQLIKENREKDYTLQDIQVVFNRNNPKYVMKETEKNGEHKSPADMATSGQEPCQTVSGKTSSNKKPPKVPFCPKEIRKILASDALLLKNAQSHTIRKIIVFASLGIRNGCEDMYELDFNHFSILRKGDPYVSPKNPGEHVLYENPGVQRKVFYPNRQNPTLCPVQILEEEKTMRPSDPCCPSCLFLCIKYGGRTRNLPQNEYVRQRMGRNKLKSFGPVMCRMAMLVHIRSGSFFFKALGITLLFMAGFPDDLVQRETKYRNLDLLQKYYRTDEDAEDEELFLSHPIAFDTARPSSQQLTGKTTSTKSKGRRQTNSSSKSHNFPKASVQESAPSSSTPGTQFGLMGYTSIQTQAMAAFQSTQSQTPAETTQVSNPMMKSLGNNVSYHNQTAYHLFPPQPANTFMPMVYWPPPVVFPPSPYPTSYGYRSYPTNANNISIHPQPYYNHPSSSSFIPKIIERNRTDVSASLEPDSDSDSSLSSSEEPKEALASCR